MKQYELQLKKTIRDLLDTGAEDEAEALINRYGPALKGDGDIYCIRADIAQKSGWTDKAEEIVKDGLDIDGSNSELLQRMASILAEKNFYEGALYFYSRCLSNLKSPEHKGDIEEKIAQLKDKSSADDTKKSVSIVVTGCGSLEHMICFMDSLYKHTSGISFELIAVYCSAGNGMKEFLDSLPNRKKFYVSDGPCKLSCDWLEHIECDYTMILPGNALLTSNWLDNLMKCIQTIEKAGMVVPFSNTESYYHQPGPEYESIREIQEFARGHNISDVNSWEENLLLLSRGMLVSTDALKKCLDNPGSYADENYDVCDLSFRIRRQGYKLIYAKDTFVYYFKVIENQPNKPQTFKTERDRRLFQWRFGVDPWDDTAVSQDIVNSADYNRSGSVRVLGINPRCGGTLLKIKENFRLHGVENMMLYAYAEDERYIEDLKSVCSHVSFGPAEDISGRYEKDFFDIILMESPIEDHKDIYCFLKKLKSLAKPDAQLLFIYNNNSYYVNIYNMINNIESEYSGSVINKRMLINDFKSAGFDDINVSALKLNIPDEYNAFVKRLSEVSTLVESEQQSDIFSISRFVFSLKGKSELSNILIYPGFDTLLEDKIFTSKSEEIPQKKVEGRADGEVLKGVFREKGYNLMTIDRGDFEDAEYIIFEDVPKKPENSFYKDYYHLVYRGLEFFNECLNRGLKEKMVLIMHETPGIMPENYDHKIHECFNMIFTWNDELVDNKKYFKYNRPQPSGISRNFARSFKNRKLCTSISSNSFVNEDGELYSERLKAIRFFEEKHPDKFDFFGRGWDRKQFKCFKGAADSKMEVLGRYKFCIAYENSCAYKGNITGKIFDCLLAGCVPIYLGAPNITDYIPQSTFIDMRRFLDYDELYEYINTMPEARYSKYLESINNFLHSHRYYKFTDIYYAESIANILARNTIHSSQI